MNSPKTHLARVAAGSMIFESWDIAVPVVTHMVNQGITDFYILDHRSSGDPRDRFLREIPAEAKIRWVRKNSPIISQASVMTSLAHLARKDGFDAFVPFDADEFFTGKSRPLVDEVREWLATSDKRALLCGMENFYQSRDVEVFTPEDLSHVHYLAQRGEMPTEYLLDRNFETVRYAFSEQPKKAIIRLVPGSDGDFDWLLQGNHRLLNMTTGEFYPETKSTAVSVLHLPCRSRSSITVRRAWGIRNKRDIGMSMDTGDVEFDMPDSNRDTEWNLSSVPAGTSEERIMVSGVAAVRDERLSSLSAGIVSAIRPPDSTPAECIDDTQRIAEIALDMADPFVRMIKKSTVDTNPTVEMRAYRQLERKVIRLQAKLDTVRPNLLRMVINRLRRR
jgi:hypothetical protein